MILDSHVERVQDDLRSAAALGGEELARAVDHLAGALDASLRLAMIEVLAAASAELSAELAPGSIAVQLEGGAPQLVAHLAQPVDDRPAGASAPPDPALEPDALDDELARISLRISTTLKRQIETAAAGDQVSVNTWISRTLTRAMQHPPRPAGESHRGRLQGWAY